MKFEEVIPILSKDEAVMIAGGEVVLKRKLMSLIGGVPIYGIMVVELKGWELYESLDELCDASLAAFEAKGDIRRCIACGGLPEEGYYKDYETGQYYCGRQCMASWMNNVHGKKNWKEEEDWFFEELNKYWVRENEKSKWKQYKMEYVPKYDFEQGKTEETSEEGTSPERKAEVRTEGNSDGRISGGSSPGMEAVYGD